MHETNPDNGLVRDKTEPSAPQRRRDEAIRRSMMTRLNEDTGLEGREVDVTVADGLVHLWGNVESEALRTAARIVAESVRSVSGVVEHFPEPKP